MRSSISGWVVTGVKETKEIKFCHVFFSVPCRPGYINNYARTGKCSELNHKFGIFNNFWESWFNQRDNFF